MMRKHNKQKRLKETKSLSIRPKGSIIRQSVCNTFVFSSMNCVFFKSKRTKNDYIQRRINAKWKFLANARTIAAAVFHNTKNQTNKAMLMYLVYTLSLVLRLSLGQATFNASPTLRTNNGWKEQDTSQKFGALPINVASNLDNIPSALTKIAQGPLTTKRSISEHNTSHSILTTIAPPLLTTLRYTDKAPHQQQINLHHRNYEFDLERDHALPTSAPNADILKSNSNPSYPNPNRHHNHDRERHRHFLNSTPTITDMATLLRKNLNGQPVSNNDMPSYSPPARAFFTPPLPPQYENPFADKPTLRGTNNEGIVATSTGGSGSYINRRPIPPPSLMPGHERIPLRPPDTTNSVNGNESAVKENSLLNNAASPNKNVNIGNVDSKAGGDGVGPNFETDSDIKNTDSQQEILPSIRRILSGSNGNKGEIPDVLLKHVTVQPTLILHQPPSPPVVLLNNSFGVANTKVIPNVNISSNINHKKSESFDDKLRQTENKNTGFSIRMDTMQTNNEDTSGSIVAASSAASATFGSTTTAFDRELMLVTLPTNNNVSVPASNGGSFSSTSSAASTNDSTWTIAWNIHVYLSVILFTVLAVYSFYKLLTYNKLTHLFPQSYFLCIHIVLITIATTRVFYLCYDAYNINTSFHLFVSEILLNLPATLLTISFSVLMLFLFRKSLSHKHNRYSALIRPLTVIVGCGVHVVLCITLHYVESYTMHNYYQQQQIQNQQQQQQFLYQQQLQRQRQTQQKQLERLYSSSNLLTISSSDGQNAQHQIMSAWQSSAGAATIPTSTGYLPPPRVLSLICQIIYIFVCLSMGLLYLYLYRILKRILRSKSQNYIHGYQNLSYAIHITIATALLFVLLAILQIFGAIGISAKRPLSVQYPAAVVEIDWLQWGYQFSLRLIEVAIITLISWVTGLKTKSNSSMPAGTSVGNIPLSNGVQNMGSTSRGKVNSQRNHTGFFLPCTSTSSQEHFETDYPVVCSANTNLHTYTMRTGKLIYDDSFPLSSLAQPATATTMKNNTEIRHLVSNYQRPYETNSLRSSSGNKHLQRYPQHQHHQYVTTDYLTDATTDHYENPNFDLQASNTNIKFPKTTSSGNSTTTASSKSGGAFSCAASGSSSQQQILLLQSEGCYSEPNNDFNNFERPKFGCGVNNPNHHMPIMSIDNTDRRDSNSCASSGSSSANFTTYALGERRNGKRYTSYNSFEPGNRHAYNAIRKSGTLNNICNGKYKGIQTQHHHAEICHPNEVAISNLKHELVSPYERTTLERSNSRTPLKMHREFQGSDLEDECAYASGDGNYADNHATPTQPVTIE